MSTTHDGKPRPADPPAGAVTGCAALTVFALVTVVFAVLRLAGAVDWPWWVVTAPLWGSWLLAGSVLVVVAVLQAAGRSDDRRRGTGRE